MSELINYSTGTTVPAAWLNRAQLREEGKASYVVYSAGGTVYAKAMLPAGIDYSGANAATQINSAITALASTGGNISVRAGIYTFGSTDQIVLKSGIGLIGEGDYTPFYNGTATGTVFKRLSGTTPTIVTDPAGSTNVRLADVTVDTGFFVTSGLQVQNCQRGNFQRISLINNERATAGIGLNIVPSASVSAPLNNVNECVFRDFHMNSAYYAVHIKGADGTHVVTNCEFDNFYMVNVSNIAVNIEQYGDTLQWLNTFGSVLSGGKGMVLNSGTPASDVGVNGDVFLNIKFDRASGSDQPVTINKNTVPHYLILRQGTGLPPYALMQNNAEAIVKNLNTAFTPASISVTASPFTYTNGDDNPEIVTVNGGTVSSVTYGRSGNVHQVASATNVAVKLEAYDAMTVTYSSAPTMTKYPGG